jgi:hypothetical protein
MKRFNPVRYPLPSGLNNSALSSMTAACTNVPKIKGAISHPSFLCCSKNLIKDGWLNLPKTSLILNGIGDMFVNLKMFSLICVEQESVLDEGISKTRITEYNTWY